MNNREAYNVWAEHYDTVENKTRDLEARALREMIKPGKALDILEIGCGTGKNTVYLLNFARQMIGADFSDEMLARAAKKINADNIEFSHLDLREEWDFAGRQFDLITCSLALEHLENIDFVFGRVHKHLRTNGLFYFGELHPFKQYQGSKARFDTESGVFELECFIHHISEFFEAAKKNYLETAELKEWFDDDNKTNIPRLLTMIFRKTKDNSTAV